MSEQPTKATVRFNPNTGFEFNDIDGMFRAAECYLQSGFAPSAFKTPQQLVICWARGAELGLRPLQAIDGLTVINNRIGIMGDLALAMVRQAGELADYSKEWSGQGDDLVCEVLLQRKGGQPHTYSFSVREAKVAGIYNRNPVWPQYSKRMTYYRALGFGLRDEFSDILKGLYTSEELDDMVYSQAAGPQEPPIPPLKFVDADAQQQTSQEATTLAAQNRQTSAPLETQLRKDFPQEAQQAETKFAAPSTLTGTVPHSNDQSPLPDDIIDMSPPAPEIPPPKPAWSEHEIKGIRSFLGRTVGSLTANELQIIESKWIPALHQQMAKATQEQIDDGQAIEARIEHDKTVKPW